MSAEGTTLALAGSKLPPTLCLPRAAGTYAVACVRLLGAPDSLGRRVWQGVGICLIAGAALNYGYI
jgi:hypothetical protein